MKRPRREPVAEAVYAQDGVPVRLRLYVRDADFLLTIDDAEHVVHNAAEVHAALPLLAIEVPGREGYEHARAIMRHALEDFWKTVPLVPDRGIGLMMSFPSASETRFRMRKETRPRCASGHVGRSAKGRAFAAGGCGSTPG